MPKITNLRWESWAALLLTLAWAGAASAGQIGLTFVNDSPTRTCTMNPPPAGYSTSTQFYIGQSNFTLRSYTIGDAGPVQYDNQKKAYFTVTDDALTLFTIATQNAGALHGYCIDTYQTITNNWPDVWDVVNLNTNPTGAPTLTKGLSGTDAEKAAVAAAKVSALHGLFARHGLTANPTADEAAAIGAVVWEIVNETTGMYSLSGGSFKVSQASGNWASMATTWLGELTVPPNTPTPELYALVDTVTQDFVIAVKGVENTNPVPEPFTVLTAFLAVGGLGMYIRRRSGRSGLAG